MSDAIKPLEKLDDLEHGDILILRTDQWDQVDEIRALLDCGLKKSVSVLFLSPDQNIEKLSAEELKECGLMRREDCYG